MSRASSSTVPPLYDSISDSIKADECYKANLRNFFFTGQALVDGSQKNLPANNQRFVNRDPLIFYKYYASRGFRCLANVT